MLGLAELFRGKGAHADPIACVEDISAGMAGRQIPGFPHSIGQLLFHMNYWMDYELRKIRGQGPKFPEHNAESFPSTPFPSGAESWDEVRRKFAALLGEFATLARSPRAELDRQIDGLHEGDNSGTLEAMLWWMVAHNSYHVGQIAMIRRVLGAWPPKAGGDTW